MARSDQRRLEAILAILTRYHESPRQGGDGSDEILRRIESAAGAAIERTDRTAELNTRLSQALHTLKVGVVVCDEHGDTVYRNVAASSFGGARLGSALADRATGDLLERARRGECAEHSLELFSPIRRNLTIRAYPISSVTGPLGAVAVIEDVSERRRLDAIRRDFVANVSHELKTPVGALSLLAETLDGEDDPDTIAILAARVGAEAERLGRIIDDLLDLSRIESDERPPFEVIHVHQVVSDAVEPLGAVAEAQDIKLDVDDVPAHLAMRGDHLDLVSAVSNLADNAIKYSGRGSLVRIRVQATADSVRIDVVDQGIGIPARDRERIFERFYRVDRARSRLTGGTGLGLSIVRHVAANHGGEIKVQSQEGQGSTFSLLLPLLSSSDLPGGPNG